MILHPVLLSRVRPRLRRALGALAAPLFAPDRSSPFPPNAPFRSILGSMLAIGLVSFAPSGCARDGDEEGVDVAAAPPRLISGRYDVKGVTRTPGSQDGRRLAGTVILVQQGDSYTATYELSTTWPAGGADAAADVVGVGEGVIEGDRLDGEARTQLVISSVPGVDPGFAFVPRMVTARIVSTSVATLAPDGSITIELHNHAAEGEQYDPTRTRLVGRRVEVKGVKDVKDGEGVVPVVAEP